MNKQDAELIHHLLRAHSELDELCGNTHYKLLFGGDVNNALNDALYVVNEALKREILQNTDAIHEKLMKWSKQKIERVFARRVYMNTGLHIHQDDTKAQMIEDLIYAMHNGYDAIDVWVEAGLD